MIVLLRSFFLPFLSLRFLSPFLPSSLLVLFLWDCFWFYYLSCLFRNEKFVYHEWWWYYVGKKEKEETYDDDKKKKRNDNECILFRMNPNKNNKEAGYRRSKWGVILSPSSCRLSGQPILFLVLFFRLFLDCYNHSLWYQSAFFFFSICIGAHTLFF